MSDRFAGEIYFALTAAFLAALIAALWSETSRLSVVASVFAGVVAVAAVALLQFSHGTVYAQDVVAIGGLILATMVAAHLRRDAKIESFWQFDLQLGIASAMGVVALGIVYGGLALLLASCHYLFDLPIRDSIYIHLLVTCAALLAPLFALAMLPANMDEPFVADSKPDLTEKAVFYVLNFALTPLVLVYAVMLHIYAAKIAITQNMPKGEVGRLVLTFGIIGTATYMIAYPWREVGFRTVRWFMRSWFWLMVIPTVLLALAVLQRIAEYGVTQERYCLYLFAMWLVAMAIYMGVARGKIDLRAIPASLALALLLSSFGPWGAASVSIRSQLGEFRRLLETQGVLVDGRLKLDPPRVEKFARLVVSDGRLQSVLNALESLDALNRIEFIFAGANDDPFVRNLGNESLRRVLGMEGPIVRAEDQAAASQAPDGIESDNSIALKFDVGHYDLMVGPIWLSPGGGPISVGEPDSPPIHGEAKVGGVKVAFPNSVLVASSDSVNVSFNLAKAIGPRDQKVKSPILVPAQEGRDHAIVILMLPPQMAGTDYHPNKFQAWLLLNTKAPGPR